MVERLTRRSFVIGAATAPIGLAGTVGLAGCQAGASTFLKATPFFTFLGDRIAEGFAWAVGDLLAGAAPEFLLSLLNDLTNSLGAEPASAIAAWADDVVDSSPLRGVIAGIIDTDGVSKSATVMANNASTVVTSSVFALGHAVLANHLAFLRSNAGQSIEDAIQELRSELQINVVDLVDGADALNKRCTFRALTTDGRNIEVEWDPTTDVTKQTRLTVRRGLVLQGREPRWEELSTIEIGIPSFKLWDPPA